MKKSVLIMGAVVLSTSLMGLNYLNDKNTEVGKSSTAASAVVQLENDLARQIGIKKKPAFFFDMGSRFRGIKKQYIDSALSVEDFLSEEEYANIESYNSVKVILIENEQQSMVNRAEGNMPQFTKSQLAFLKAMDYSSNFVIRADFEERNPASGKLNWNYVSPHLTVVPEKQAEYKLGNGAFYEFIREESKKEIDAVNYDELFPAKLYFTITKEGELSNLKLMKSSNHPELDEKMVELMQNLPGEWEPAENAQGEKVDQELVLSFGMVGC